MWIIKKLYSMLNKAIESQEKKINGKLLKLDLAEIELTKSKYKCASKLKEVRGFYDHNSPKKSLDKA